MGERVRRIASPGEAFIVTDEGAYPLARRAQVSMEAAGTPAHMFVMPPGERSKTLEMAEHLYGWLAGHRAERGHLVLAVGGGVVGDLAGFVAATFLRGVQFGQVPTTLLAMMDAAIGGKTAVDLSHGKNLVGAFHQPRFVLADVQALETLPGRQVTAGWAEAIKHGLILDERLLHTFEEQRDAILALERRACTGVIRRSVALKAQVVSRDERETLGVRLHLNYGHTLAHAIEAATGYERYLHGEAVSIGMMGAALISNGLGLLPAGEVERQRAVLEAYGLPVTHEDLDVDAVYEAMAVDKKTAEGAIHWVLLDRIGHAVTRSDVPRDLVKGVLNRMRR
jgi:3-dehydroquinate synthase